MEYIKIYNQIIERAKTRKLEDYKENHHIIPRCMGGLDEEENLVELTAREHFLCHKLLCEIYPNNQKLWYALFLMSINKNKKTKYIVSSREYEYIKKKWNNFTKNKPKPKGFGDKIKSEERNKKIGKANSKPKPKGFGEKISKINKGKKRNETFVKELIKRNSKPVLQYDKQGNLIKEWESVKNASFELKINPSVIAGNARNNGVNKSAGGYIWRYKN